MTLVHAWLKIPFWQRVAAGFVLGMVAGWLMGPAAQTWFGPLGTVYVNLIKMIAIPLVFFAVVSAVGSLAGQRSIAALAGRTFLWFAITAVLAVAVGLAFGLVLKPGVGVDVASLQVAENYRQRDVPGPLDVLMNIVPENPFRALAALGAGKTDDGQNIIIPSNFTILQVIFFAGLLGFALVKLGEKTAGLRSLFDQARELMIQVTKFVLEATPIGTFGLIAALVGSYGFEQLVPLGKFVIALYAACAFHILVVYTGLLLAHGLSPLKFFRGAAPAMQIGFVASSSFAALPLSLSSATHNLGVDKDYASFAVPLGASIKMDGCGAIYPALAAVFIAQFMGIELSTGQYFIIALASVLGSFGTAGVPGTAVIMATVVISAAGLPLEAIGILYAIDRILDMMRTMTNVTGQVLVPVLVAK
ncbi:MAG TPA: dicarboxylate/amino acid:cation symporter, partial [Luteimonas sp.]|nr:dicarboxylate/amino acid:cation symporter [Luteimonas sp.]